MRLVYKFDIGYNEDIYNLCKISKNLYNQALYILKQELREHDRWVGYSYLNTIMQNTSNLEGEINYRLLKAQVAQQCLRVLDKNVKSYIKAIKDYSKHREKYKGVPRMPKYKKVANQIIYPNQSCTISDGYIKLSKTLKIKIPQYDKYKEVLSGFQQVRINPRLDKSMTVEIVYDSDTCVNIMLDSNRYASVDLGVSNLATMVLPDSKPILFNGGKIKARNQYFNKKISKLKSELPEGQRSSKQIKRLYVKRENQIKDIFHKLSREIVNELIEHRVGNIVVGYNKGWKDSIELGKKNNQTFVQIPYATLISYLKYKCEMCGIQCIVNEESYTSKCDGLALETIEKHEKYLGRRIKRGMYQSSLGKLINADVNGALNIMRKVVGDSVYIRQIINSGWLFQPIRVNIQGC